MQIAAKSNQGSFADTFTPQIKIIETYHDMTVKGANSTELLVALDARQVRPVVSESFLDRGVPRSPLND